MAIENDGTSLCRGSFRRLRTKTSYAENAPFSIVEKNWAISLTMIFGSFIAGATSEGGGAVAFPVFTKLLNISAHDAKIFSLAIQSIGMSAASVLIVTMRIPVEWRVIRWGTFGGIFGITLARISHEFRSEGPQGCVVTRCAKVWARKRTCSTLST